MTKYDFLGVQSVLRNLSGENDISLLNNIMSLCREEIELLYNSDWILKVVSLLESNSKTSDICLKILLNASKKYEEVRSKLLKSKIFYILTIKLRQETDFWKSDLILYSALMVVLVQGNSEAQNQMRISGCLSSVVNILSCILDKADSKSLPYKNTELLLYTIIASNKNPNQLQNQTEIGWIIPKVLEYLERQTSFSNSQLLKCFWFFLKTTIEKNETNQYIFIKSSGVRVLFRNIQGVLESENCCEKGDLLAKITGTLLKMRKNTAFLYQASHYCCVMILCEVLKTCNCMVIQQIVIFLDHLTQEFPHTLQIMKTKEIQKQILKAKIILRKSKTTAELCQNLFKRLEIYDETSQDFLSFDQFNFLSPKSNFNSQRLEFFTNPFCIIHEENFKENSLVSSHYLFDFADIGVGDKNVQNQILNKIRLSTGDIKFHKKQLEMGKKMKEIIVKSFRYSNNEERMSYNIGRRIVFIFRKLLSFFGGVTFDFNKKCIR